MASLMPTRYYTNVQKPVRWIVRLKTPPTLHEDGSFPSTDVEVYLDEDHTCFHDGAWQPRNAEDAIKAAAHYLADKEYDRLRHDAIEVSATNVQEVPDASS